jgi:two-component system NtrC family sensor kinase
MSEDPEKARLEQQVADLTAELEKASSQMVDAHKMASLGRLLAAIVHEINTPIGSILSNNEVVLRSLDIVKKALSDSDAASLARAKDILETCRGLAAVDKIACERITSVIRGLKTFARVDSADLRKAGLNECLSNTLKLTQCEFRRRVLVETDFRDLPQVECHPQMLGQVFLNLLVNAGQAIEGEGRVTVRTRREGDCVHISIADTGRGIRLEDRSKIFSSGFTTKPVGVGTGLGLAISKQIVEEVHHGSMDFESEVGVGTTFHIRLPIEHRKEAAH